MRVSSEHSHQSRAFTKHHLQRRNPMLAQRSHQPYEDRIDLMLSPVSLISPVLEKFDARLR